MAKDKEATPKTRSNRYKRHVKSCNRHADKMNIDGFFKQIDYLQLHFPEHQITIDKRKDKFIEKALTEINKEIRTDPTSTSAHQKKATLLSHTDKPEMAIVQRYFTHIADAAPKTEKHWNIKRQKRQFRLSTPPELKPLKAKHLNSVPKILAKQTARYDDIDNPTEIYEALYASKYFKPILELFALERNFSILTKAVYENTATQAQYWSENRTVSFKGEVTADSAIHELCHHAEEATGTIKHIGKEVISARKNDRIHYLALQPAKKLSNKTQTDIYDLVVGTAGNNKLYDKSEENEENIVRIAEAIAVYGKDAVKKTLPNLYAIYKYTFLDQVKITLDDKKNELLDNAVTYIIERVFKDSNSHYFGAEGKALTKQQSLKEQLTQELTSYFNKETKTTDFIAQATAHKIYKPLEDIANTTRSRLFEQNTFTIKPSKKRGRQEYISVQPQNLTTDIIDKMRPHKRQKTSSNGSGSTHAERISAEQEVNQNSTLCLLQ